MTKRKHPIDIELELSRLSVIVTGGVFRETLPGRGITRIYNYPPLFTSVADNMTKAFVEVEKTLANLAYSYVELIAEWSEELERIGLDD